MKCWYHVKCQEYKKPLNSICVKTQGYFIAHILLVTTPLTCNLMSDMPWSLAKRDFCHFFCNKLLVSVYLCN